MRKVLAFFVLSTFVAGCSGDEATPLEEEDTGGGGFETSVIDTSISETEESDTSMAAETTADDVGDETPADTSTPADTMTPPDTMTPADTMMADTRPADTMVAVDTAVADTGPIVCTSVVCTTNAQCTALGCGTCNTGPGRCRTP